jgi:hypothetical protein
MNELSDLLQPLVDLASPGQSIEELTRRARARERRRKLGFSGVIAVVIAAAALAVALLVPTGSRAKVEVVGVPDTTSGVGSGQAQAGTAPSLQSGLKLAFTTQPGGGPSGSPWATQPVVTIEHHGGHSTIAIDTITLAITSGPSAATLTCTGGPSLAATDGVATFSGCQIIGPVGTYTLTATDSTSGSVVPASSFVFTITVGTPAQLVFTTQPGGGPSGAAWATQPVVTIEDSGGNTVTTSTDTVSLAITGGPSAPFTCSGGRPTVAARAGVATFSGCQITGPPVFYSITASDPPLSASTTTILTSP